MAARLGVLIVHGQGHPEATFADGLIKRLNQRLGPQQAQVTFEPCYWAPILQQHQDRIWKRTQASGNLAYMGWREWVVSYLGDPATYLSGYFRGGRPVYGEIHEAVRVSLTNLEARVVGGMHARLLVLAPSLGSIIVSNYFWDESHGQGIGQSPLQRMETLVSLITYGSTIPLFVPPSSEIVCIRFPSPALPAELQPIARWHNLYDPHDLLGYPLRKLWDDDQGTDLTDVEIDAGVWPLSQTPLAHNFYESDHDFLELVIQRINAILAVPGP